MLDMRASRSATKRRRVRMLEGAEIGGPECFGYAAVRLRRSHGGQPRPGRRRDNRPRLSATNIFTAISGQHTLYGRRDRHLNWRYGTAAWPPPPRA